MPASADVSARTRRAVLDAAIEIVCAEGYEGLSIDAIARRAGVARSTIYRHWATATEILIDAVSAMHVSKPEVRSRHEVGAMLAGLAHFLWDTPYGSIMAACIDAAERHPDVAALLTDLAAQRGEQARQVLLRAQQRGIIRADVDAGMLCELISGALFRRRFISREPADRAFLGRLDAVLEAVLTPVPAEAAGGR